MSDLHETLMEVAKAEAPKPKRDYNVNGDLLSSCDCCGEYRVCKTVWCSNIETGACAVCRGGELCPICLDDKDYCDHEVTP